MSRVDDEDCDRRHRSRVILLARDEGSIALIDLDQAESEGARPQRGLCDDLREPLIKSCGFVPGTLCRIPRVQEGIG